MQHVVAIVLSAAMVAVVAHGAAPAEGAHRAGAPLDAGNGNTARLGRARIVE